MRVVAGIRFKSPGKIYYFDPNELELERGMHVIVDTAMGEEYGEVVLPRKEVEESNIRYGGFTSVSWDSNSGEKRDEHAFIVSINNKKMFKTTNYNRSIYCSNEYGHFFGGNKSHDYELWFSEKTNCGFDNNQIYSDLNKECTQGLIYFVLDELEVYQVQKY